MTSYMSSIKAKAALILLHTGSEVHSFARLQSFFLFYTGCFKKNKKKKKNKIDLHTKARTFHFHLPLFRRGGAADDARLHVPLLR